jgi:mannose-6-phosphate isomerase-like protein (cupin superfamily)
MTKIAAVVFVVLAQGGAAAPIPATDISAAIIQATIKGAIAAKTIDTPIRTVDAGGHHVGLGVVQRPKGTNLPGGAVHDFVSEVYHVLEGSGTLVTGGTLVNPQRRDGAASVVVQINGPGVSGSAIQNGVRRRIAKGDVVIIPAGTPHWFSEIEEDISYTVVRIDPRRVVTLK